MHTCILWLFCLSVFKGAGMENEMGVIIEKGVCMVKGMHGKG
jgi:hypothetical protein